MNFVTKQIIDDLKDLIELKNLLLQTTMSDNKAFLAFIDREIDQHVKDIMHSEKI